VSQFWRPWLQSPKHGLARRVAVYGSSGFQKDSARLADHLADCRKLRAWAQERDVGLDDGPGSLAALDHALDPVSQDARRALDNDCGLYLGTVIVHHQHGAQWHVWPNGHPVVLLASGRVLDVVAAVHDQPHSGQSRLATLYADATRRPQS
jgi:hypothetical protein